MIHINFRDARPIYEQVKDGFCQLILSGALPPNYKLPSVRELAAQRGGPLMITETNRVHAFLKRELLCGSRLIRNMADRRTFR